LKPKIEIRIASPAKTDTEGASAKKSTPALTMLPKVGVGGGTPTPKKLKLASSLIAVPSQKVLITRISPKMIRQRFQRDGDLFVGSLCQEPLPSL